MVGVEEQEPLADGVEDGLVVLVHPRELRGLSPWVCRRRRRAMRSTPAPPIARAAAPASVIVATAPQISRSMWAMVMPTATSATTCSPWRTGTTERTEGPSEPVYSSENGMPLGASPTCPAKWPPMSSGRGWV